MSIVTSDISVSMDGFSAGVGQTRDLPFGTIAHDRLHDWMFERRDENELVTHITYRPVRAEAGDGGQARA